MERIKKEYTFSIGHIFRCEDGQKYKVIGFLGRGGQGEVYRVTGSGGDYAVKWYKQESYLSKINKEAFKKNLIKNINDGLPKLSTGVAATQFIWPLKLIQSENGSFGYLMQLFPKGYEPLTNAIMLRRRNPDTGKEVQLHWGSWFACVTAALNIARAFEILHKTGLSYQDLNEGGIIVDMSNGDVMICDCDNVSPDGSNLGIKGIMPYMAPEVVLGKKRPDRYTDQYSLAVILFRLFFHGHPMHGVESCNLHNSAQIAQYTADSMIYGSHPHYCLASEDNINPPDPNKNGDVYRLRNTFPMALMDAFEQVFTEGIHCNMKRLTATEWRKVLLEVRDSLVLVDGEEQFYHLRYPKQLPQQCLTLVYPHGRKVLCMPGKVLYMYHLSEYGTDFTHPVAKVISSKIPGVLGLYNFTGAPIRYGKDQFCANKGRMPLMHGMELEMNGMVIRVE